MMTTIADVLQFIRSCQGDAALLNPIADCLKAEAPRFFEPPPPPRITGLPDLTTLVAMQASFYDNGADKFMGRYKCIFEFWLGDRRKIKLSRKDHSLTVQFYTAKQIKRKLSISRAKSLTEGWRDDLKAMADDAGDDWLIGPVTFKGGDEGSGWLTEQVIIIRLDEGRAVEAVLMAGDQATRATVFDGQTHQAKPHNRGVQVMARVDYTGLNDDWACELGTVES